MRFLLKLRELLDMYIPSDMEQNAPSSLPAWLPRVFAKVSLDAAGLVALADLTTIARRTALTGTAALSDALVLCPGLHRQQDASNLNSSEYPICAAMTTGYVFRVENQATVLFLQDIGRTGHLTCLTVSQYDSDHLSWLRPLTGFVGNRTGALFSGVAYSAAIALTVIVVALLVCLEDWWGLAVVVLLMLARLINIIVIQRRAVPGWKGEPEPGKQSDLIILLSQDRWFRLRGPVDDVKAITSGEWLRKPSFVQSSFTGFATLLVYLNAALAGNASKEGKVLLLILLFGSVGLLALVNEYTKSLHMYGRTVKIDGEPQAYARRLLLAKKLIKETGRSDWAIRLGMAQPGDVEDPAEQELQQQHQDSSGKASTSAHDIGEQVTL